MYLHAHGKEIHNCIVRSETTRGLRPKRLVQKEPKEKPNQKNQKNQNQKKTKKKNKKTTKKKTYSGNHGFEGPLEEFRIFFLKVFLVLVFLAFLVCFFLVFPVWFFVFLYYSLNLTSKSQGPPLRGGRRRPVGVAYLKCVKTQRAGSHFEPYFYIETK